MKRKFASVLLGITLSLGFAGAVYAEGSYIPGTYTASAQGFGGEVEVSVEVSENAIDSVTITGSDETPEVGGAAIPDLENQIMESQSKEVEGVSGATFTSTAVKEALAAALLQAEGEEATEAQASLVPGTYTATKEGFQRCHVTVSVTVDEDSITDVTIDEVTDHPQTLVQTPCEQIPADILANQTYNVDGVTGATMTSNAIKNAVRDCLDQAGGSEAFSAPVEHADLVAGEDVETDVLVIGGGGAGMLAAIEAYSGVSTKEQSGLSVTLIEKAGFLGGSTNLSGGVRLFHPDPNEKYDEAWVEQAVQDEMNTLQPYMELPFNEDLIRSEMEVMVHTNELLEEVGVNSVDAWGYLQFAPKEHEEPKWFGSYLTEGVNNFLPQTDIDVRLNTRAMELLTDEEGAVIGASVQDKTSTYNIYAKKVILSCGGFAKNPELIKEYCPDFVDGKVFAAGANTGDGIIMAREIGAEIIGDKMFGHLGADEIEGARPDYSLTFYYGYGTPMYINMNGERFVNEDKNSYVIYHDLLKQDVPQGWGIIDADNADAQVLEDSESQYVLKAETLEELAELMGVPADNLKKTVESYNACIENGEDTEFGTALERMDPITDGPYYAFILSPITFSSLVSVKVDGDCRVLNTDGQVIPNLFAAGDMVLGGNLTSYYFDARGVGTAVYTGDLCGKTVKAELLGE